jgi:integrase
MGRKQFPGLIKRAGIWHIDKRIGKRRICRSTGTADPQEAERFLARVMEQTRQANVYGVRPVRTFEQAAAKFVLENQHKQSIASDISCLRSLMPYIGSAELSTIHMGTLNSWIARRRSDGRSVGTINHGLQIVRRICNLATGEWVDDRGLTWTQSAPRIKLLSNLGKREPHPLSWAEQKRLFGELPPHLAKMALFCVNTGTRDGEVCGLRWDWEQQVAELGTSVFVIPSSRVKNGDARLVVLNRVAKTVIESQRGKDSVLVFPYKGAPIKRMNNTAWRSARCRAGLEGVRIHDLKQTFGRRLRASGVSFEDRQDLLGHRSGRITTHYSAAELFALIAAAETVCETEGKAPEIVVLRGIPQCDSRKTPAVREKWHQQLR